MISSEATSSISCMARLYAKRKVILLQVAMIFCQRLRKYLCGPHPHLMGDTNLQKTRKRWDYSGIDRIMIKIDLQIKVCKSFIINGGPSRDRTEDLLIKSL